MKPHVAKLIEPKIEELARTIKHAQQQYYLLKGIQDRSIADARLTISCDDDELLILCIGDLVATKYGDRLTIASFHGDNIEFANGITLSDDRISHVIRRTKPGFEFIDLVEYVHEPWNPHSST